MQFKNVISGWQFNDKKCYMYKIKNVVDKIYIKKPIFWLETANHRKSDVKNKIVCKI